MASPRGPAVAAAFVLQAVAMDGPGLLGFAAVPVHVLLHATIVFGFWATYGLVGLTLARGGFWHEVVDPAY